MHFAINVLLNFVIFMLGYSLSRFQIQKKEKIVTDKDKNNICLNEKTINVQERETHRERYIEETFIVKKENPKWRAYLKYDSLFIQHKNMYVLYFDRKVYIPLITNSFISPLDNSMILLEIISTVDQYDIRYTAYSVRDISDYNNIERLGYNKMYAKNCVFKLSNLSTKEIDRIKEKWQNNNQ